MLNKFIFLLLLCLSVNGSYAKTGKECTTIKPPLLRLSCFDKAFDTPIYREKINNRKDSLPVTVKEIFNLQAKGDNSGVAIFQSDETVKIVVKDLANSKFTPSLFLGCVDNITHFQVALKRPLREKQLLTQVIDTESGKILFTEQWQVLERGYLLDIGRGLFAIEKIKKLLKTSRITYVIPSLKYRWYFNTEDLNKEIIPLRKSCGW
ncbi:type VI secretion system-associated protein TagO [Pasteurella atlantica]|uniref:Type VI secretion system-associated protein TagO n=2 Tax=Pasteurellaceae TaxID=712 RepID=A0ACC6HP25_9PAST|nr:type VI secretion system-associated protein TagO [Pasteurella atlantica]MDP8052630.1 type VI secretion system-associated protein TagO [Pasteurella atlantica]MDP8105770.1 type VI secretion system-associated protein TagO [Pasteurella atlantica]MDP8149288.1 type VI secretion system-associated protein TagO [Pasteurella atlantica]